VSTLVGLLDTMSSALSAQQAGLDVTGQNVANVNTPGYVQRRAVLEDRPVMPGDTGGVNVAGITRSYNAFTYGQMIQQQGYKSAADARSQSLTAAQAILTPGGGGDIGGQLTAFFSSLSALTANPGDPSARQAVLSNATQLATSISTTSSGLAQQQQAILSEAQGVAGEVNGDLTQIADLNEKIQQAQAMGDQAPDLRDKRDTLVTDVAAKMGASVVADPSGSITLFAGGTALVVGNQALSVSVTQSASGGMAFAANGPHGQTTDITSGVNDGELGGLREARDVDIAKSVSQLDQFAYNFANAINAVHQTGYGLDGVTGRNLFVAPSQVAGAAARFGVDPSVAGKPSAIAAASTAAGLPGANDAAIALSQLAQSVLASGSPPSQTVANIGAQLGSALAGATSDAATRADTLTQAQNLNSSESGVNLNEETVKMAQFQQAFQASTKVLQITAGLMSDLLGMMR
jgi:flagellar hook-associated protein 1 FlgK